MSIQDENDKQLTLKDINKTRDTHTHKSFPAKQRTKSKIHNENSVSPFITNNTQSKFKLNLTKRHMGNCNFRVIVKTFML